ncbi:MAG TPA: hypothetical protein VFY59_16170, partial [Rubrobacter sp.]|nr:hypothetical protein [Rubrobacter sp.]
RVYVRATYATWQKFPAAAPSIMYLTTIAPDQPTPAEAGCPNNWTVQITEFDFTSARILVYQNGQLPRVFINV